MIEAILFDFGRVISAPRPSARFREYESQLGIAKGSINQLMFDSPAWRAALVGRMSMQAFWHAIGPSLNLKSRMEIDAFRRQYYRDEFVNPKVLSVIRRLHGIYRLAVLSNHPPGIDAWLQDWQIHHLFDVVVGSGDVGYTKPDPKIYQIALDSLGVRPSDTLFIDDTPGHVRAAEALGMHGIVYVNADRLVSDLHALTQAQKADRHS